MRLTRLMLAGSALIASAGTAFASQPVDGAIGFQEAATPVMEKLTAFHNNLVFPIIVGITLFVMVLMIFIMIRFNEKANPVPSKTTHHTWIEIIWTVVPVLILVVLVFPSFDLLYMQDDIKETDMTIKVTGQTWYWEYGYPEFENIDTITSTLLEKEEAKTAGKPYLLGTDAPLVVPVDTNIKVLVTSGTNIHSFAMPAFGVKMDAIPGRINETWFNINADKVGTTFYGQCSEICGVRHAYMPIEIKAVSKADFEKWVANDGAFASDYADNSAGSSAGGSLITAAQE